MTATFVLVSQKQVYLISRLKTICIHVCVWWEGLGVHHHVTKTVLRSIDSLF